MASFWKRLRPDTVSVLRLEGVIGGGRLTGGGLNDAVLAPLLEAAFRSGRPKAVALAINSPGGSPVQSSLIAARIRRLAEERKLPVHAFCEDVAASGGYWLAAAADHVWADANSILGSIGVISASFGFHEFLARQGVERRVHTAGAEKSFLDPFRPEDPRDLERLSRIQGVVHRNFIDHVRMRRGDRLTGEDLFTGAFWTGAEAVERGLADGIAHLVPKMQELYGDDIRFRVIRPRRSLFRRLGAQGMVAETIDAIEARAAWARFGL